MLPVRAGRHSMPVNVSMLMVSPCMTQGRPMPVACSKLPQRVRSLLFEVWTVGRATLPHDPKSPPPPS